jgi:hypothetical protein
LCEGCDGDFAPSSQCAGETEAISTSVMASVDGALSRSFKRCALMCGVCRVLCRFCVFDICKAVMQVLVKSTFRELVKCRF